MRRAKGSQLAFWFTTVESAHLLYISTQGNFLIHFNSFHSKDANSLILLLLHFQVSLLQVLFHTCIMLVTPVLPSAEMAYRTLFPKSWVFSRLFWDAETQQNLQSQLDNDDTPRTGNPSDVTIPHFHVAYRALTCKGQHFLLEWAKVLRLYFNRMYSQLLQDTADEFRVRSTFSAVRNPIDRWFKHRTESQNGSGWKEP